MKRIFQSIRSAFNRLLSFLNPRAVAVGVPAADKEELQREIAALKSMLSTIGTGNEAAFSNLSRLVDSGLFKIQFGRHPELASQIYAAVSARQAVIDSADVSYQQTARDQELTQMFRPNAK